MRPRTEGKRWPKRLLVLAVSLVASAVIGCGKSPTSPSDANIQSSGAPAALNIVAEQQFCVDFTNQLRASVGFAALQRSATLEGYAMAAAASDAATRTPHDYFQRTGGGGVAFAENQMGWWQGWLLSRFGSLRQLLEQGLRQMWAEGPSGGHYRNIVGPYREVGCGFHINGDHVTIVQAFR